MDEFLSLLVLALITQELPSNLTNHAEKAGVDGIMLVAPYYNKPSQEGLYQHFKAIAEVNIITNYTL